SAPPRRRLRRDHGWGAPPAGARRAIGFAGKSDPGACDRRLLPQEGLRQERQDQYFDHREDDDERGDQHRYDRPGTVAIAADTPQIEMPDASGAAHSRLKPNHLRATKYTTAQ